MCSSDLRVTGPAAADAAVEPAVEEAAVELAEEPPQALRAAAAPQAAAAVRNERREIFFISVSSFRAVCVFLAAFSPVPGSRALLLTLGYRTNAKTGMEKFREELQFFCIFKKKMYFLTLESALSCFLAQFTSMVQEKSV